MYLIIYSHFTYERQCELKANSFHMAVHYCFQPHGILGQVRPFNSVAS